MEEDEAALLAELQAISNRSAGTSRFNDTDDNNDDSFQGNDNSSAPENNAATMTSQANAKMHTASHENNKKPTAKSKSADRPLPPWKRKGAVAGAAATNMAKLEDTASRKVQEQIATPPESNFPGNNRGNGSGFVKAKSKFSGERGGDAEDADLLAELQAISKQSGAANRFASNDQNNDDEEQANDNPPMTDKRIYQDDNMHVIVPSSSEDQVSVLSEASMMPASPTLTAPTPALSSLATAPLEKGGFQKPAALPNTFQGDRGGAANDEELLAELKAISTQSSSVDRFSGDDSNNKAASDDDHQNPLPIQEKTKEEEGAPLPPWKQKKKAVLQNEQKDVDSVVAAPSKEKPLPPWKRKVQPNAATKNVAVTVAAAPAASSRQQKTMAGFQKPSTPNTFQGDRGGAAEDEALLAELMAISSKSGSNDRFVSDDNDYKNRNSNPPADVMEETPASVSPSQPVLAGNNAGIDDMVEETASTPPSPPIKPAASNKEVTIDGFQKPDGLSTRFQGERGGAAEDEDLLAELRAISSNSGAANRFAAEDKNYSAPAQNEDRKGKNTFTEDPVPGPKSLPPWKRISNKSTTPKEPEVVVAALPDRSRDDKAASAEKEKALPQTTTFQTSNLPNTFKGERGGVAEDEDLLAELRAISSGGASRFSEEDYDTPAPNNESSQPLPAAAKEATYRKPANRLPPWKKKGEPTQPPANDVDVDIAAPPASAKQPDEQPLHTIGGFEKSDFPNTFKGDRGGVAEDDSLLAELRAISTKASSSSRFADDVDELDGDSTPALQTEAALPPWKRTGNSRVNKPQRVQQDVVLAASPPVHQLLPEPTSQMGGFEKPNHSNTFQGERGGAAEDEELLAELRAISSGAGGTSRFNDEENFGSNVPTEAEPTTSAALPLWTGKGLQNKGPKSQANANVVASQLTSPIGAPSDTFGGFQKSEMANTFKGGRGGAAEDEALLAELKAISSSAGGASRFTESNDDEMDQAPPPTAQPKSKLAPVSSTPTQKVVATTPATPVTGEANITMDDLPGALSDKSWKLRKEAYILLKSTVSDRVTGKEPTGEIDSDTIVEGLDSLVPGMLGDSNASALDSALDFALLYAEHCRGATMSGQAEEMMIALVKGSALSSSRPTTVDSTSALVLKLIEVGEDGTASAHAVVDVLLRHGLASKKPKVVIMSSSLILLTATSFGAACLPLAQVTSFAPKMLSHSNVNVRGNGMRIIAEISRALGSTSHIQGILDGMKKAQIADLNSMIQKQPQPAPISVSFRNNNHNGSSSGLPKDALAALQAGNAELEAQRFASRPAVNLVAAVAKTEYSSRLTAAKWSEKVAALDMVLECGGEKPYKLMEPSSSVNYGPLISDMKKMLGHTHFAVVGKSLQVLAMLAEGVGEKLFPYLRPLISTLFGLGKDKKLIKFVNPCLDAFFGHILAFDHLFEDDVLPEATNEKKEKNALARTVAIEFLGRCVTRGESAGPRGGLTVQTTKQACSFSIMKLEDSDAGVRKAAMGVLQNLQGIEDEELSHTISDIIDGLRKTNPRAHKTLSRTLKSPATSGVSKPTPSKAAPPPKNPAKQQPDSSVTQTPQLRTTAQSHAEAKKESTTRMAPAVANEDNSDEPTLDDSIEYLSRLDIPKFGEDVDNDGVLAGLKSTKWMLRQNSIKSLASAVEASEANDNASEIEKLSGSFIVAVKEHTRGFQETNVNVTKAIMEFFITICDYHYQCTYPLMSWAMSDAATLAVEKLADKKLSALGKGLLSSLCTVCFPHTVVSTVSARIEHARSPIAHEECQNWFRAFCNDFGAASLGNGIKDIVPWLLKETSHSNIKVKKAAFISLGTLHTQMGPIFKALLMSLCKDNARDELEKVLDSHHHDATSASAEWPKVSIASGGKSKSSAGSGSGADDEDNKKFGLSFDIPRMDLFQSITGDCVARMGAKDGKTAWKIRKQAIDEVDAAVSKCSALLDTSPPALKRLAELVRALRDRLSDSQGNLKPLSARVIGSLLSVTDAHAQAKLGRIVHSPLINGAVNDIKKPVREASLDALIASTTLSSFEGGEINKEAVEGFLAALADEINDTSLKSIGLPDVLDFAFTFIDKLTNLENVAVSRGQTLGEKASNAFVKCLTSSKADTRNKAEKILAICVQNNVLSLDRIKSGTERMKPAQQRTVGAILAKLARAVPVGGKENIPSDDRYGSQEDPVQIRHGKPASAQVTTKTSERSHATSMPVSGRSLQSEGSRTSRGREDRAPRSPRKDTPVHPLISTTGHQGVERARSSMKSLTWPEYPEEPLGSDIFNQLKRAWSAILPPPSAVVFFPAGGVRKQDDGHAGCDLLCKAILMERAGEGVAIEEQLDFIFRWLAMVLCSKEHTVGLSALLTALNDLFVYLHEIKYEISDSEAMLVVPFIFEKAALSKGRFKELFDDLLLVVKAPDVLPAKRLGSVVAVNMIERASHAKVRLAACHDCSRCVDQLGLSGIGKKGVLVAAKALSEEKLSENRTACLDLMELILSRMNGDVSRLARICGSSLSGKARTLVEERWQKHRGAEASRPAEDSSVRRSRIPTPKKSSPTHLKGPTSGAPRRTRLGNSEATGATSNDILHDELPHLNFSKVTDNRSPARERRNTATSSLSDSQNYVSETLGLNFPAVSAASVMQRVPNQLDEINNNVAQTSNFGRESVGAAASLRARLMKIRERSSETDVVVPVNTDSSTTEMHALEYSTPAKAFAPTTIDIAEKTPTLASADNTVPSSTVAAQMSELFGSYMDIIDNLLAKESPLHENDKDLDDGIECMKKFHAALSKQSVAVGISEDELFSLRETIGTNSGSFIETLTALLAFSLDCEMETRNSGISVSLLSVCLATLMALFRDRELAHKISTNHLKELIQETGTALLDSRLVASSGNSLDEATCTQVVRAINKLAVQAATGGNREFSLDALLNLQRDLSLESDSNARLARVVTKLFTRVIKAEDSEISPWKNTDLSAVVVALNKHLEVCAEKEKAANGSELDAAISCKNMANLLVESILKTDPGGIRTRNAMTHAGISEPLESLVTEYAPSDAITFRAPRPQTPSRGVASLVSALGGAQSEADRQRSLMALREYISSYGDADLNTHLEHVSPQFRSFILDQLSSDHRHAEAHSYESAAESMAERLKTLRSRLNSEQASETSNIPPRTHSAARSYDDSVAVAASTDSASVSSHSTTNTSQSLRARLQAAQKNRASSIVQPEITSSTGSRAAALRARLQSLKQSNPDG